MEDERFRPTPSEASEPSIRDRFSEALARIMGRESFSNTPEEDDDEETTDKKKRRRRGASGPMRRFFSRLLGRREGSQEAEDAQGRREGIFPTSLISLERVPEQASQHGTIDTEQAIVPQPLAEQSSKQADRLHSDQPSPVETNTEQDGTPRPEASSAPETAPEEAPETAENSDQESLDTIEAETAPEALEKPQEEELGVLYVPHDDEVNRVHATEATRVERPISTKDSGARRLAVTAAGFEYIGRKRADAKLRRNINQQSKKLETVTKQTEHNSETLQRLTEQNERSREQLAQRRAAAAAERQPEKPETARHPREEAMPSLSTATRTETARNDKASREQLAQKPEKPSHNKEQQYRPERLKAQESSRRREPEESREAVKEQQLTPEKVLETTARAAEINAPVEKAYELRHEHKDEPASMAAPVAIGSVLKQRPPLQTRSPQWQTPIMPGAGDRGRKVKRSVLPNMPQAYQQAVTSGFIAALVLIAAIITGSILS